MPAASAPAQAPMPSTSRTKPRTKASRPDSTRSPSTAQIDPGHATAVVEDAPRLLNALCQPRQASHSRFRAPIRGKPSNEVGDVADFLQAKVFGRGQPAVAVRQAARQRGRIEAELGRFLQPGLGLRHLADFAGQPDLAEIDHAGMVGLSNAAEAIAAATARSAAGSLTRRPPAMLR